MEVPALLGKQPHDIVLTEPHMELGFSRGVVELGVLSVDRRHSRLAVDLDV